MPASDFHLYYSPGACSIAPHIVLEEIGAPYTTTRVTIAEGLNSRPEYLAINKRGRVPALAYTSDGERRILTEAMAIMVFLAQLHPDRKLLPDEPERLCRALEWMGWLGSTLHQTGFRIANRPEAFVGEHSAAPHVAKRGRELVDRGLADIETRLAGLEFSLGTHFSVVDAYLIPFYRWGNRLGIPMRVQYPEFTRVTDSIRMRPAVRRIIEKEGVQID